MEKKAADAWGMPDRAKGAKAGLEQMRPLARRQPRSLWGVWRTAEEHGAAAQRHQKPRGPLFGAADGTQYLRWPPVNNARPVRSGLMPALDGLTLLSPLGQALLNQAGGGLKLSTRRWLWVRSSPRSLPTATIVMPISR
jgi:hypothetical protein